MRRAARALLAALVGAVAVAGGTEIAAAERLSCGASRTWLVPFQTSPFPYDGVIPGKNIPFLDREEDGRRGHTSPRGGVYWEDPTYSDRRVLLSVPPGFDPARPAVMVVYFHGNSALLDRDVCRKQHIPQQVAASGLNAVLVAPQLARDALDSSAGAFWQPNAFRRFLDEAGARLADLTGQRGLRSLPVVVVAYSGGYLPAAYGLDVGGAAERIRGILLMDALYGEAERFAEVVAARRSALFAVSAYSLSSKAQNAEFRRMLADRGVETGEGLPPSLRPGTVTFVPAPAAVSHGEFMTRAFAADPLRVLLGRIEGFAAPNRPAGPR